MREKLGLLGCLAALGVLLLCSADTARAVREGLALCAGSVIPALFPFLAVSGLLTALDAGAAPGRGRMLLARVLGCGPAGAGAFLLGLVGGYPVGARTVAQLYREKRISRPEACRLLLFCNNCGPETAEAAQARHAQNKRRQHVDGPQQSPGPAFILGVAGLGCFGSLRAGGLLWAVHMLAALSIALVLPRRPLPPGRDAAGVRPPAFAAAFVRSVRDAAGAMVQICGFVVFFLAALRLTARLTGLSHPLLSGAVELTQGILALPATPTGFVWAAALLGWGGLSVHGQSAAVLSGTDLPLGPYLAAKAAQAALSALLAWPVSRYLWG